MSAVGLRPYQQEAVDAVFEAFAHNITRPVVVLPTGTGKSFTMAEVARRVLRDEGHDNPRVLVLAHRGELMRQIAASVVALDDTITVGTVKATTREYDCELVVASVQTLAAGELHLQEIGRPTLILVDEAHHYAAPSYRDVLVEAGAFDIDPAVPAVGFTATMWRSDGKLDQVWDEVVYEKDIVWAVENKYLVPPVGKVVVDQMFDTSEVRVEGGEFVTSELEKVMMASIDSTVDAFLQHCVGRATIVFAVGVTHAQALAEQLTQRGFPARAVVGSMSAEERQEVYELFHSGEIDVMVTVTVLTEGADFPRCDCVLMARPTHSKSLYIQMVGRALRLYEGKESALVVDLTGTSRTMSLASLTDVYEDASVEFVNAEGVEVSKPEEVAPPKPRASREGALVLENIDLLSKTWDEGDHPHWLRTPKGTAFLANSLWVVYVLQNPQDHMWYVCRVLRSGFELGLMVEWAYPRATEHEAMDVAVGVVELYGGAPKRAKNHFKNIAPTEKQISFALALGIESPEQLTRGRVKDEIESRLVGRRIDR